MSAEAELIDLSAERISLSMPASVREAAGEALDAGQTHYTDRPGVPALREAVALKLSEVNGIHVAPADEVLITCGTREALFLTLRVLVTPGSEVILPAPALPDDVDLVRSLGAAARIAPAADGLELNVDEVEALISDDTSILLLRLPTPVGQVVAGPELERLGELAVQHDLWVISVESGETLTAPGLSHRSIASVAGLAPRTVTINDFTGVGLDSWRVGYLAAQREILAMIRGLKQELSICSPAVSQYAALAAMSHISSYTAAVEDRVDTRRVALTAALAELGLHHNDPRAGMYVLVYGGEHAAGELLQSAERHGLKLADGGSIGAHGWLRLTLDHDPPMLAVAAQRLAAALGALGLEPVS